MNKRAIIVGARGHGAMFGAALAATVGVTTQAKPAVDIDEPEPSDQPDRLSIERGSPFYTSCGGYVGVKLDGVDESGRVVEFCRSGGWVRLAPHEKRDKPLTVAEAAAATQTFGVVETFWRMAPSRQVRRQLARIK